MSYSDSVIEFPFPLMHHSSSAKVMPIEGASKTLVTRCVEFTLTEEDSGAMAIGIHEGVILPGFQGFTRVVAEYR